VGSAGSPSAQAWLVSTCAADWAPAEHKYGGLGIFMEPIPAIRSWISHQATHGSNVLMCALQLVKQHCSAF